MYQRDFERLERIKKSCKICQGSGYKQTRLKGGSIRLDQCRCAIRIEREGKLIEANIPMAHRRWTLGDLNQDFRNRNPTAVRQVQKYIAELDHNIELGKGFWFCGPPGTAKSSIICAILKKAIEKNYRPYYDTAAHLVSLRFQDMSGDGEAKAILKNIMHDCHIVAIDEIDKRDLGQNKQYRNITFPDRLFYELLADLYNYQVPLMVSSNTHRDELEETLPSWIRDRFKSLTTVPLLVKSGRRDFTKDNG